MVNNFGYPLQNNGCTLEVRHCELCGNTDQEDLRDTYTACCNELVSDAFFCSGDHLS